MPREPRGRVTSIPKKRNALRHVEAKEVWSAWVGYEDKPGRGKYRPVLVIDVNEEKAVVMSVPFTSTFARDEYDIEVFDWKEIPLDHSSTARISKTIVVPVSDFRKKLGIISEEDWENITELLMQYMENHEI